jgi:hypothetical protein
LLREIAHLLVGCVIVPGIAGAVIGVIFPVDAAALEPQAFEAVTETVPTPEPIVIIPDVVPCPPVTDQPVPVTDHV